MKRHKKSNVRQNHIKRGVRLFTVLLFIGIVLFSIFLHNYLSRPAPEIRMIITEYAHNIECKDTWSKL